MAIQFARIAYISRSKGGNACHKAAYNERSRIPCERTGQVFNFRNRKDLSYHEVLLPEGVSEQFKETHVLWNAAESAERRKDSQVAKECVIALPDNPEITHSDRVEITKRYAHTMFVSQGLAAQIDIHAPHEGEKNWHAHILVTTRGFTEDGQELSPRKARETDPSIKKGYVQQDLSPGAVFAQVQNDYFRERGLDIRVDPTGIVPQRHIGPVRMRGYMDHALERANLLRESNEEAVRNPDEILKKLTQNQAAFTLQDLDTFLKKHVDVGEGAIVRSAVLSHPDLIPLYDPHTQERTPYWTTQPVRSEEEKGLRFSGRIHRRGDKEISPDVVIQHNRFHTLSEEQQQAVKFATLETPGLTVIEGRAGTGKSYTMQVIREIYEQSDLRVIGLAPTNQVSADMGKDGFGESMTAHSFLFRQKNNRLPLEKNTVLIVDEAAMLGTSAMIELLKVAQDQHCKMVLFGDDRQLSSVDRGGLFSILCQRYGSCSLTEVRRQVGWHKDVSEFLSEGNTPQAVALLSERAAVQWEKTKEDSLSQLVQDWAVDSQVSPSQERLILANKNRDVDTLNWAIREIRVARGEVSDQGHTFQTTRGAEVFAVHDRVCLTVTDKAQGLHNGSFGTITALNENQCAVALDSGKDVTFDPQTYPGLKLGYAATVYKSQGKSIPEIYVLHDPYLSARLSYVALTRHKESLKIYANTEETRDLTQLTDQMRAPARNFASLRFMTAQEIEHHRRKEQGDRNILDTFRNVLKKTKNFVADALHENREFYQIPEKKIPEISSPPPKVEALKRTSRGNLADDLIQAYQNYHRQKPNAETIQSYMAQVDYERGIGDRNLKYCEWFQFKMDRSRAPTAFDLPDIYQMADRLSGIESGLYREAVLRGEKPSETDIRHQARTLYAHRCEREAPIIQNLQQQYGIDLPIAQKVAELSAAYEERTGFSASSVLEKTLIDVAQYWIQREQESPLTQGVSSLALEKTEVDLSLQVSAVVHHMRVHHEITQIVQMCARDGKMPEEMGIREIQKQSEREIQPLEREITLKVQREQQRQMERLQEVSRGIER